MSDQSSKMVQGIVISALLALSGWAWLALAARVDAITTTVETIRERQIVGYGRLAKNEAEIAALKESLIRIEKKLDEALREKK